MTTRRELLIALGLGAFVPLFASIAQTQGKVWRIGFLDLGSRQSSLDAGRYPAYLQGMRELGYVEGKHFVVETRFADGNSERLATLAAELVRLKVNVILTFGTSASRAVQLATASIPVVVMATADPVRDGFAMSLARPGGNITGLSSGAGEIVQKWLELLTIASPRISRIAVLLTPANSGHSALLLNVQVAAQASGRHILPITAGSAEEIERGFASMARQRADAVIVLPDTFFFQQRRQITALAIRQRLPSATQAAGYAEAGGLIAYGPDLNENCRRAAAFVDRILKGAKPGELPFELPTRYQLVINRKTASTLGLVLPQELLLRAERVIE